MILSNKLFICILFLTISTISLILLQNLHLLRIPVFPFVFCFSITIGWTTTKLHPQSMTTWLISLCSPSPVLSLILILSSGWSLRNLYKPQICLANSQSYKIRVFLNCSFWIRHVFFRVSCMPDLYICSRRWPVFPSTDPYICSISDIYFKWKSLNTMNIF